MRRQHMVLAECFAAVSATVPGREPSFWCAKNFDRAACAFHASDLRVAFFGLRLIKALKLPVDRSQKPNKPPAQQDIA